MANETTVQKAEPVLATPTTEPKQGDQMLELGSTGLKRTSGLIQEEFLKELAGSKAVEVYREMSDNDPIVGSVLFAIEMLIRQVVWRVDPASDAPEDKEIAEFVDSCRTDMSMTWEETLSEIISLLPYGWSYHEIVYKRRAGPGNDPTMKSNHKDGRYGWRKLPIRAQDTLVRWEFDESGGIRGMWQSAAPDFKQVFIPIEKALLFRTRSAKGNPEGRSVLRNAYRPWYFKKNIENLEGIGIERDLAGIPVAWLPPEVLSLNATPDKQQQRREFENIVKNIRRDEQEGLIMPLAYDANNNKKYDFSLLSSNGKRNFDTNAVIGRYDQRIAMTVLADFILLGHEKVGSFSLASSKTNLFTQAIAAWVTAISEVFNRFAIPRLLEVNGIPLDRCPKLTHGDIETVDLKELGDYIAALAGAGATLFPNDELQNWLLGQAGAPVTEEDPADVADILPLEVVPKPTDPVVTPEVVKPQTPEQTAAAQANPSTISDQYLNGAQVTSLVDLGKSYKNGEISREAAKQILLFAFKFTEAAADAFLSGAVTPPPADTSGGQA